MKTFDVIECAEFLKVERTTILKLAGAGELPGAKIGRAWVFIEDDVVDYIRKQAAEQARKRLAEAELDDRLDAALQRQGPAPTPRRRGRPRRALPALDDMPTDGTSPESAGQGTAS